MSLWRTIGNGKVTGWTRLENPEKSRKYREQMVTECEAFSRENCVNGRDRGKMRVGRISYRTRENMENKEYQKVIDYICQQITAGKLAVGNKLPTERQLSEQMGVSRNCVREALRIMETFGMIECRQGSGNYLSCRMSEPISEIFSMMLLLGATNQEDLKEFRMELDKQACRTLAARADRVELADQLLAVLEESSENEQAREQSIDMDARFHYELLQFQGNPLWMTIADAVLPVYRKGIKDILLHASGEEEKRFYELHRAICMGIRDGSYAQCEQAIEEHYRLL